ncbi:MAG: hypothetical protein ACUVV0_15180, partial [Anaerolineae bacterium]
MAKRMNVMEGKPERGISLRWILAVAMGLAWAFAIYAAYYWVHKPFTADNAAALLSTALDIALWLGLLAIAFALGRRCLESGAWHFGSARHLEELVFSLGLGLGLLSMIIFALGLAGCFKRWLFWVL